MTRRSLLPSHNDNGIALVTALVLGAFLFVMGVAFLTMISNDINFSSYQNVSKEAYFLAQSGVEYYKTTRKPADTSESPKILKIPQDDNQHIVEIIYRPEGDIEFHGKVLSLLGGSRAERTLIAPGGDLTNIYER